MTDISEIFGGALDASEVTEATSERKPLSPGEYDMCVLESEMRTFDNDDECITIKFEVLGGEFNGRWHWNNYMTKCAGNIKRVEYAKNDLTRLVAACGLTSCTNLDQLIGRRFSVRVEHNGRKTNGDPYINLKGYKKAAEPTPAPVEKTVAPDVIDELVGTTSQQMNDDIPF